MRRCKTAIAVADLVVKPCHALVASFSFKAHFAVQRQTGDAVLCIGYRTDRQLIVRRIYVAIIGQ